MPQNLPNLLTGLRIVAIPLMVVCYYLPQPVSTVGAAVVGATVGNCVGGCKSPHASPTFMPFSSLEQHVYS